MNQSRGSNWIQRHFANYLVRRPWGFAWRIGVESTVVSLVAASLLAITIGIPEREFLDYSVLGAFVLLVLVAPPVETLLLQALPVGLVRLLGGSIRAQILVSTILFAAAHFPEGVAVGIAAGVIGGLYFGFAYAHWRKSSRWQALWVTTAAHSIHNGIALLLLIMSGAWT